MTKDKRNSITKWSIISIFVGLYILTSVVSTIHVIDFFRLSNPDWLAVTLAIAFEIGAAASLGAIIILEKTNKTMVWLLFCTITGMQMMGNMFYSYTHLLEFQGWSELFGLIEEDIIFQKRILSIVSGAILPLVALGFIKSLVDYIKPEKQEAEIESDVVNLTKSEVKEIMETLNSLKKNRKIENSQEPNGQESKISQFLEDIGKIQQVSKVSEEIQIEDTQFESPEEEEANRIIEQTSTRPKNYNVISGYYGDVLIDDLPKVKTEESEILPVNSNKKIGSGDNSQVHINPTRL